MIRQTLPVKLLLRGSYAFGLPRLGDRTAGSRLRVLMYHGVTAAESFDGVVNHYGYNVPRSSFEQQVAYLSEHCNPVSLNDVLEGRLSDRRTNVLVTFDDGYENNFTCALPVLERYGVPALFALPTGFVCDRQPLWNDIIERAVDVTVRSEATLAWEGEQHEFELTSTAGRGELLMWLMRRAAGTDPAQRAALISMALRELDVDAAAETMFDNADYRPLEAGQVRGMAAGGLIELASHSVSHFMMARLPLDAKRRELIESKRLVETLSGRPCRAFCVPGGSYDEELLEAAVDAGYEVVLTSDWGWADRGAQTLKRCGIFAGYDKYRFVDEVHGPVVTSLVALRRALRGE